MKVCASLNTGPFMNFHKRFDTIHQAVAFFKEEVIDNPHMELEFSDGLEYSNYGTMDLYPQCDQCFSGATFHDYPMSRYGIGRKRGLVKVKF